LIQGLTRLESHIQFDHVWSYYESLEMIRYYYLFCTVEYLLRSVCGM